MQERVYQAGLIKRLHAMFPGCIVIKNDPEYMQGIPDLLVLYGPRWAMLEAKVSEHSRTQPNQEYYVELLDGMSFSAFIYPSNEEEVLDALQSTFEPRRATRLSKRK